MNGLSGLVRFFKLETEKPFKCVLGESKANCPVQLESRFGKSCIWCANQFLTNQSEGRSEKSVATKEYTHAHLVVTYRKNSSEKAKEF